LGIVEEVNHVLVQREVLEVSAFRHRIFFQYQLLDGLLIVILAKVLSYESLQVLWESPLVVSRVAFEVEHVRPHAFLGRWTCCGGCVSVVGRRHFVVGWRGGVGAEVPIIAHLFVVAESCRLDASPLQRDFGQSAEH
jgi:hypothetical protein